MTISQRMNAIIRDNSFVIFSGQCYFINLFGVDVMQLTSKDIHTSTLFSSCKQTIFIIIMSNSCLYNILLNTLTFLVFRSTVKHLIRVQLCPQAYKLFNLLTTSFIFEHPDNFLINSGFDTRWMIFWILACIKSTFNIVADICIKVISLYLIR